MARWYVIAHGDSDGVCAAALAVAALGGVERVYFSHPAGLYEDLEVVKPGCSVVVVDIALCERRARDVASRLKAVKEAGGEVVYIDHHPAPLAMRVEELPGTVVHSLGVSASELAYRFFSDRLEPGMSRVALYGAIGDYLDETPWVKRALEDWDKRAVYFEAGVLAQGLEGSRRMYEFKRHVVAHLAENRPPSSLSELLVRALIESAEEERLRVHVSREAKTLGLVAYIVDPPGSVARAATYARAARGTPIGVAVERRGRLAVMSVRSVLDELDLNEVLRRLCGRLGGTGGGHRRAAGARIPFDRLDELLKALDEEARRAMERGVV